MLTWGPSTSSGVHSDSRSRIQERKQQRLSRPKVQTPSLINLGVETDGHRLALHKAFLYCVEAQLPANGMDGPAVANESREQGLRRHS